MLAINKSSTAYKPVSSVFSEDKEFVYGGKKVVNVKERGEGLEGVSSQ